MKTPHADRDPSPDSPQFAGAFVAALSALKPLATRRFGFADAEDALQEAAAVGWERKATFEPSRARLICWLFWKVRAAASKQRRRKRPQSGGELDFDSRQSSVVTPPVAAELHELGELLSAIIATKPGLMDIVRLRVQGFTWKEISAVLRRNESTLRVEYTLARRWLSGAAEKLLASERAQAPAPGRVAS